MQSLKLSETVCESISTRNTLIKNLRKCAKEDTSILPKITELKNAAPGALYRVGQ